MKNDECIPGLPAPQGLSILASNATLAELVLSPTSRARKSHDTSLNGIEILVNLLTAACGSDPDTGDGAGLLIQISTRVLSRESETWFCAAPPGDTAPGGLLGGPAGRLALRGGSGRIVREEGLLFSAGVTRR